MTMLASDDMNPQFVGAHNPDDRLAVRFFLKAEQNNFLSQQEGRPVFEDKVFVRIEVPGDAKTVIETYAREEHQRRFPRQWLSFQANRENPETGTPLSDWPLITASQAEMLKAQKFRTVESIANASDLQLQSIGMIAGMAPKAFQERARAFLAAASGTADVQRMAQELAERDEKLAAQAAQLAQIQEQMAALMAERKKPGPKPKVKEEAEA
jgi:hypothetical protein